MLKKLFFTHISLILNSDLPRVSKKKFARANLFGKQIRMSKHIKNDQANFNLFHRLWKLIKCFFSFTISRLVKSISLETTLLIGYNMPYVNDLAIKTY